MDFIDFCSPLFRFVHGHDRKIGLVCSYFCLGPLYVTIMGILGSIFALIDIIQIAACSSPVLPEDMQRARVKGSVLTQYQERDLKLIISVFTVEYYLLLVYAVALDDIIFVIPWILMQTFIILFEFLIFLIRIHKCDCCNITRQGFLCAVFSVFNWLQVFCFLRRYLCLC